MNRASVICGTISFPWMTGVQGKERKNEAEKNILRSNGRNVSKFDEKLNS